MATQPLPVGEETTQDRLTPETCRELLRSHNVPESQWASLIAEVALANELQDKLVELAEQVRGGTAISGDELFAVMNEIGERHGCDYGIPIPVVGSDRQYPLRLADRAPLQIAALNEARTEFEQRLQTSLRAHTRNSWNRLGDITYCIVDTEQGPMIYPEYHAGGRLRKILAEFDVRQLTQQSVEAEEKALKSLRSKINENQYRLYFLCGSFIERSLRSDIHYIFRKGKPTLALSFHGNEGGKCIAALCMHPMGYYQYTHVGLMCPTDEVIAALLMMRGDERKFWSKSGQWHASDPRSGI